jgi:nicotinamidase-related amidase
LDAAYCVKSTILAAVNRGYDIFVIEDALLAETQAIKEEMIKLYQQNGVNIISAYEYLGN